MKKCVIFCLLPALLLTVAACGKETPLTPGTDAKTDAARPTGA